MSRPAPAGAASLVAQRILVRYAKRGRMRFASHRDIARAVERGVRVAGLPVAYSAGFSPHPKISYLGGAPTGAASEAEYLEISLTGERPVGETASRLDDALPDGIDVIEVSELTGSGGGPRLEASVWQVALPGVARAEAARAVQAFLAADSVTIDRLTSKGTRRLDARAAVLSCELDQHAPATDAGCIIRIIVQHQTPVVRPDDILAAFSRVAALAPSSPPVATRLAQGPLGSDADGFQLPGRGTAGIPTTATCPGAGGAAAVGTAAAEPVTERSAAVRPPAGSPALGSPVAASPAAGGPAVGATAISPAVPESAYEQLPRGAESRETGASARERDGRLPGCSRPSETSQNTRPTRQQTLATSQAPTRGAGPQATASGCSGVPGGR
jgi:radical SAM-linked protein